MDSKKVKLRQPPVFFELADLISAILACTFNLIAVAIMKAKKTYMKTRLKVHPKIVTSNTFAAYSCCLFKSSRLEQTDYSTDNKLSA
jgi:hypothetical protein